MTSLEPVSSHDWYQRGSTKPVQSWVPLTASTWGHGEPSATPAPPPRFHIPGRGQSPARPEYLLFQPAHALPVGALPSLQRALRLHLGTAQALQLLLQLVVLQPAGALVLLQRHHLGLREGRLVRGLALCVCARACKGMSGTSQEPKVSAGTGCRRDPCLSPMFLAHLVWKSWVRVPSEPC